MQVWMVVVVALAGGGGCGMPGRSFSGALPAVTAEQKSLADQIKGDVTYLAGSGAGEIGNRDTDHPANLAKAADYIEAELKRAGWTVTRHPYVVKGQTVFNLDAQIKGELAQWGRSC